jgi:DNA-binding winged helix-turn-helix (wHTH) protein
LNVDLRTGAVYLGYREVIKLGDMERNFLRYLYEHYPSICPRADLYYKVHEGLEHVPAIGDKRWVSPKTWGGNVDTILWRIRQAIEPNPANPKYVITEKRQGVRLDNVA